MLPDLTEVFQVALMVKNLPANAGDVRDSGSVPGLRRSPGGGHGNPVYYSCLENPTDWGAWWAGVHSVTESDTIEVSEHGPMLPDFRLFTGLRNKGDYTEQSAFAGLCCSTLDLRWLTTIQQHNCIFFLYNWCYIMLVVTLPTCLFILRSRLKEKTSHGILCSHDHRKAVELVHTPQGS